MQAPTKDPILATPYNSHCSNLDKRFDPEQCQIAAANEVAPFPPKVYVEGDPHGTNMRCRPIEFCLLRDLDIHNHGFKCDNLGLQPSAGKLFPSLNLPMLVLCVTDDVAILRPGHVIFAQSFLKGSLHVNLPDGH